MDKHFTVTINDSHGVKQYNLHHFVKKAILYAVLFLSVIGFISIGTILYLNNEVDAIKVKRIKEQSDFTKLQEQNNDLLNNIKVTQKNLQNKKEALDKISEELILQN